MNGILIVSTDNEERLLPPFDQGISAFIADLDAVELDSTLLIALGFGGHRINKDAGKITGPMFILFLWPERRKRGVVVGESDQHAAFPKTDPIAPWDLAATMYHLLGIGPETHVFDRAGRPFSLSPGRVVTDLLS